ncbi:Uncharacterised protein [Collinsella sp. AK_207A]|nr:Uncharacterised protein [Collinsella sp. AK_207A]
MHSPNDASTTHVLPSQRANQFSFPPTQRFGLLASPVRSQDQRENLQESYERLLDSLELRLAS